MIAACGMLLPGNRVICRAQGSGVAVREHFVAVFVAADVAQFMAAFIADAGEVVMLAQHNLVAVMVALRPVTGVGRCGRGKAGHRSDSGKGEGEFRCKLHGCLRSRSGWLAGKKRFSRGRLN